MNNNILWDKEILYHEEIPQNLRKILNKSFIRTYFENQHGDTASLFKLCQAGKVIPFGSDARIITVDRGFHSIIYFNTNISEDSKEPLNKWYGYGGTGNNQFFKPSGISFGRETENDNGDIVYPVYIADYGNSRIVLVDYIAQNDGNGLGSFDEGSFTVFKNVPFPSDVSYFKSENSSLDKIWISQCSRTASLQCLDMKGNLYDYIVGYKDELGQVFYFNNQTSIKLGMYNDGFKALAFTDKERNWIVTTVLDENGIANTIETEQGRLLLADDILMFPSNEPISSVSFLRTDHTHSLWPYLWITTSSYVHCCKINKSGNIQYLASSNIPKNSNAAFTDLVNMIMTNDYYDILTIESWNFSYGIRKYWPFCSIYNDTLYNYCSDSTNTMRLKAVFTNDCWLRLRAQRKTINNTWENVTIRTLNGSGVNDTIATKWQLAGYNQASSDLFVDLKLDLPIEDYALGGEIKLQLKLYPEYYFPNLSQKNDTTIEYTINVNKSCLPHAGGCPFIYIRNDQNDFEADNNILHRMEYSAPGVDILDVYKLRTNPKITSNSFDIYLVENEQDSAFIDKVRMFAVDIPSNKKLGVTEDNKIVIYDSVQVLASDSVMHNNTNITNNVHFHHPAGALTTGGNNDSMYAHFSNLTDKMKKFNVNADFKYKETRAVSVTSSKLGPNVNYPVAFITNLRNLENPVIADKDTAGFLTAASIFSNTVSKMFSRRELESVVILPLFADTDKVDHLNIKWQSNFRMKYLGIANLSYSGFTTTEVPMSKGSAITASNDTDITSLLTSDNGKYGEVNSGKLLKMTFDLSGVPSPGLTDKREYVIEVDGNYIKGSGTLLSKVTNILPTEFFISQNYPNPFNPVTKINYELPRTSRVNIVIYDILGREVKRLLNNELKESGRYTVEFDGKNYASGVYFYRIEAGDYIMAKKMVLIK